MKNKKYLPNHYSYTSREKKKSEKKNPSKNVSLNVIVRHGCKRIIVSAMLHAITLKLSCDQSG